MGSFLLPDAGCTDTRKPRRSWGEMPRPRCPVQRKVGQGVSLDRSPYVEPAKMAAMRSVKQRQRLSTATAPPGQDGAAIPWRLWGAFRCEGVLGGRCNGRDSCSK
jgi:hypothetical protein